MFAVCTWIQIAVEDIQVFLDLNYKMFDQPVSKYTMFWFCV
jgi:hypothetical protein